MRKEHLPIVIGIALPVLMIVGVVGAVFVPAWITDPPQTDFLFAHGNYNYTTHYEMQGSTLTKVDIPAPKDDPYYRPEPPPALYRYDVQEDRATPVTFEEAKALKLDGSTRSPDGFTIGRGHSDRGVFPIFFDGGSYGEYALKKGAYSKSITLPEQGYWNFQFLAWIVP